MALGIPRAEMLDRMSSAELSEWHAYYTQEPFGTDIHLLGHAITASTVANVNRDKNSRATKPEDFMPKFEAKRQQSPEEMLEVVRAYNAAYGGEDLTDG